MLKFEAVFTIPKLGKVKHIIRAPNIEAARQKARRVHRNAISIAVQGAKVEPEQVSPTAGMTMDEIHAQNLNTVLSAIPPEGATLNQIHEITGKPVPSLRMWSVKLAEWGLISREPSGAQGTLVLKKLNTGKEKSCAGS